MRLVNLLSLQKKLLIGPIDLGAPSRLVNLLCWQKNPPPTVCGIPFRLVKSLWLHENQPVTSTSDKSNNSVKCKLRNSTLPLVIYYILIHLLHPYTTL